jgi:DNA-binding NtrC family response regulator
MGNPVHIVVVDDDDMVRGLVRNVLSREGYQVTAVSDGEAAIHLIKSTPVHLVITDWRLLGEDGIEILERVRRLDNTIMGIVMTGYGTIDAAVTAMKTGAFDFILKPLEIAVLLNAVTKALEARPDKVLQHGSAPVVGFDAPPHFNGSGIDLMGELERHESRLIMEALRQANGVTSKAAQLLHLNRTTLVEKLKRKGLARTHSRTSLSSLAEHSSRVPSTI